jgi:glutamate decarboxylase
VTTIHRPTERKL